MLGLYALALWCWQVAAKPSLRIETWGTRIRGWALVGLAAAIAATINAHYFGILLLVPVCAAEGCRSWRGGGSTGRCAWRFLWGDGGVRWRRGRFCRRRASSARTTTTAGSVGLHDITRAYRSIFVDYTQMSDERAASVDGGAGGVCGGAGVGMRARDAARDARSIPAAEWVLVLVLAALPFCGYLLARFVTHSIEVRYVLGAMVAISAMLAVAIGPWLTARCGVHFGGGGAGRGDCGRRRGADPCGAAEDGGAAGEPGAARGGEGGAARRIADGRLYVQDMGAFEEDRYYEPDADVRARMTLVYSARRGVALEPARHHGADCDAHRALHGAAGGAATRRCARSRESTCLCCITRGGTGRMGRLRQDGARVRPVGHAMAGDVAAVGFR